MLIGSALAATTAAAPADGGGGGQVFMMNLMLIVVVFVLMYFIMIVPQQKRMRRHAEMMKQLRKGDAVTVGGTLIGTVDKIDDTSDEITVDFGNGLKIAAVRSTVEARRKDAVPATK